MRVFIGLDVSLAKTAICVVDRDGRRSTAAREGSKWARPAHQAIDGVVWEYRARRDRGVPAVRVAPPGAS
jgi:hypothetical protein